MFTYYRNLMRHVIEPLNWSHGSRIKILPFTHTLLHLAFLILAFHTLQLLMVIFFFFNAFITSLACSDVHNISKLLLTAPFYADCLFILIFHYSSILHSQHSGVLRFLFLFLFVCLIFSPLLCLTSSYT